MVIRNDRPTLPRDLAGTVAYAGVDPTLEGRALQDALRAAIATRGGYCWWDVDHAGWVVTLHCPEEQDVSGKTLEEALAQHLGRQMAALASGRFALDFSLICLTVWQQDCAPVTLDDGDSAPPDTQPPPPR